MLKIKDNVDLKQLKKFGFKLNEDKTQYEQEIDGHWWDLRYVDIEEKWLGHIGDDGITDDDEFLELIFDDLIKANMVDKVEE